MRGTGRISEHFVYEFVSAIVSVCWARYVAIRIGF